MADEIDMDVAMYDLENNFEPLTRTRSNTWPMPQPADYIHQHLIDDAAITYNTEFINIDAVTQQNYLIDVPQLPSIKKKPSRRNAWGNMSYAELITQAINSVKDKRLTLSQIYNWMVENVSFFKDKSDSSSSAGWKNSIRHNLSLHNRFVRVPNEGAGKSSWWMVNPNAGFGKSTRRRAASMEVGKYEKKRSRAKKRMEILEKENLRSKTLSSSNIKDSKKINLPFINNVPTNHVPKMFPSGFQEAEWQPEYNSISKPVPTSLIQVSRPIFVHQIEEYPRLRSIQVDLASSQVDKEKSTILSQPPIIPVAHKIIQLNEPCIVHQQLHCGCNMNIVQINGTIQDDPTQPYLSYEDQENNQISTITCGNQQYYGRTYQSTLTSIPEQNYINSALQVDNNLEDHSAKFPLIRNNSLLDDIDEIIKREQCIPINIVNESMSSTLHISQNMKQCSRMY